MRRIHRHPIDRCGRLLPAANTEHIDAIPVETGMRERCKWERETKGFHAKSAEDPYDAGEAAAAHMICGLVRDVDDECGYAGHRAHAAWAAREIWEGATWRRGETQSG